MCAEELWWFLRLVSYYKKSQFGDNDMEDDATLKQIKGSLMREAIVDLLVDWVIPSEQVKEEGSACVCNLRRIFVIVFCQQPM